MRRFRIAHQNTQHALQRVRHASIKHANRPSRKLLGILGILKMLQSKKTLMFKHIFKRFRSLDNNVSNTSKTN